MVDRDEKGRWLPGRKKTGGRKKGVSEEWYKRLASEMPALLDAAIAAALAGDMSAMKLLFDRAWPVMTMREADLMAEIDALKGKLHEMEAVLAKRRLKQ